MSGVRVFGAVASVVAVAAIVIAVGVQSSDSPATTGPPPPAPAVTATASAPPMTTPPAPATRTAPAALSFTTDVVEPGEELLAPSAEGPVRATNRRLSFDAAGQAGAPAYEALRRYFLATYAEVLLDIAQDTATATLLAPQDEFEPTAAYDARLQHWLDAVRAMFARRAEAVEWEIFGIPVAADTVWYDANRGELNLAYPALPRIADLSGAAYRAQYIRPTGRGDTLDGVPLLVDHSLISPLDCALEHDVFGPNRFRIRTASSDVARELKTTIESRPAFFSLRFRPEAKLTWWDGYGPFVGSTNRQMRLLRRVDLQVVLRVTDMAVYTTEGEVLAVTRRDVDRPANLWFLAAGGDAAEQP